MEVEPGPSRSVLIYPDADADGCGGNSGEVVLLALPIAGGFAFVTSYRQMDKPDGSWLRSVLAAGSARLHTVDQVYGLVNPRLETYGAAKARLGSEGTRLLGALKLGDMLLVMDQDHRCVTVCGHRIGRRQARCGLCLRLCASGGNRSND